MTDFSSPFAVVLTSNGCAESKSGPKGDDSSSAWTAIDIGEAEIRLEAPGLEEAIAKVERREQGWEIQEYSHWQAANSSSPEATLFLRKMKDVAPSNRHFAATRPLPESVQKWFQGETIELFTTGTAENRLGEIETLRLRRFKVIDCVLVRQGRSTYSDQISLPSGRTPLGDIVIVG